MFKKANEVVMLVLSLILTFGEDKVRVRGDSLIDWEIFHGYKIRTGSAHLSLEENERKTLLSLLLEEGWKTSSIKHFTEFGEVLEWNESGYSYSEPDPSAPTPDFWTADIEKDGEEFEIYF